MGTRGLPWFPAMKAFTWSLCHFIALFRRISLCKAARSSNKSWLNKSTVSCLRWRPTVEAAKMLSPRASSTSSSSPPRRACKAANYTVCTQLPTYFRLKMTPVNFFLHRKSREFPRGCTSGEEIGPIFTWKMTKKDRAQFLIMKPSWIRDFQSAFFKSYVERSKCFFNLCPSILPRRGWHT